MHPFEDLQVPANGVGIHWFGQSSFGLKNAAGAIVQVDPYYPRDRPPERFIHTRPPLDEASLRTDAVLLTHDHGDHTCMESIERLFGAYPAVQLVGPPESAERMREAGIPSDSITEITAGGAAHAGGMTAHAVWSKPPEGDPDNGIDPGGVSHLGFVIDTGAVRVYISGDPIGTFAKHESLLEPIRSLAPHIGMLTTHPDEGEFPFFEASARIAAAIGLQTAVPSHYQCFVTRDYDPGAWAQHLPASVESLVIPYNQSVVYVPS